MTVPKTTAIASRDDRLLVPIDREQAASALEHLLATGDLSAFSPKQRIGYYLHACNRGGLASEGRPFDWLTLDGRLVLYPNKSCAEQLRRQHQISVKLTRREIVGDMFVVEVEGSRPNGQTDFASKYVPLRDGRGNRLVGRDLANAYAKCETGAKRRLTFSMIGLGALPDLEDVEKVRYVVVDGEGNVVEKPTDEQRYLSENPQAARHLGEPTFETTATPADAPDIAAGPSQAVRPEELERPKRTVPRQSFRPSEEDVKRQLGAWFAAVKGSSLDDDDARHRYVASWTIQAGWPKAKQTDSLKTAFGRMTERESADFLAHVRAIVEDERAASRLRRDLSMSHDNGEAVADVGRDEPTGANEEPF